MVHQDMATDLNWRVRAALLIYRMFFGFAALLALPLVPLLRLRSRRISAGFHDYLGLVRKTTRPALWVHGVSMGESMVAAGFVMELKKRFPDHQIVFTTTHPDVYNSITKRGIADLVAYFPLDNVISMTRAFDRWQPQAVFVAETDFWPEFSWQCRRRQIPLILINGRISSGIAQFYQHFTGLGELIFSSFSLLAVQSETDSQRLLSIGALPAQIKVLGNMKADLTQWASVDTAAVARWVAARPCIVLGSLHPSEFELLKSAIIAVVGHRIAVVVAPRNPANAAIWQKELQNAGLTAVLRSRVTDKDDAEVLLLDSMGELASVYRLAAAALVGGTLDASVGGHNPLEVMQQHVALISGPHCRNFVDIIDQLVAAQGITLVNSAAEAEAAFLRLVDDLEAAALQVAKADRVLELNRGALQKTLQASVDVISRAAGSSISA